MPVSLKRILQKGGLNHVKNGSMKERTLDKLREESSTIYQGTRLIVF